VVTGLVDVRFEGKKARPYNSVFLIHRRRVIDFYDKVRLLPFGEFVPFPFGFTKDIFGAIGGVDYVPGDSVRCMRAGNLSLATPADLIAVLTNDAWFRDSDGTYQHMRHARIRAVENRIFVIWVNNTGPSALISPEGRILKEIPYGKVGFFVH